MVTFTPSSEGLTLYECMFLMPSDLSDKEFRQAQKDVENLFAEKEAKQLHKEMWSSKGLAYKIKGKTEGRFILYMYEMKPEHMKELDQALRLEKSVLRHLIVKPPKNYELINYEESYVKWQEEKERQAEEEAQKKEEELKKKIVKRAAKPAVAPSAPKESAEAPEDIQLEEKLGELISDEDLNL